MDYFTAIDTSMSGLSVERMRMDITALNIANANTSAPVNSAVYQPMRLITAPKVNDGFSSKLQESINNLPYKGVSVVDVRSTASSPRLKYDPAHPNANANGFIALPDINMTTEMINLVLSRRSYEANVKAIEAAKAMNESALEIGR